MDNIINTETFIEYMISYLKIAILVNKGTEHTDVLNSCINVCNKFKSIEAMDELDDKSEAFVRRCYKRFNMMLKVEADGKPVNHKNKQNQLKLPFFTAHSSIVNNNLDEMIEYALANRIDILTEIPLVFIIQQSLHQKLLWQYTRALFYISECIVCRVKSDENNKTSTYSKKIEKITDAVNKLEDILTEISVTQENIKIKKILALDNFLNIKLIKTGINEEKINNARLEVKELFKKKGLSNNETVNKMVDNISDKLSSIDLSQGNIIESMYGISQEIATTMRPEIENNPEGIQSTIGAVMEIFKESVNNNDEESAIPSELKDIFNSLISMIPSNNTGEPMSNDEIMNTLTLLAETKGLNKDEFIKDILNEKGEINFSKIEQIWGVDFENINPQNSQ